MNRALAIAAAVASVLYLFLSNMLGYPAGAILKTSMCVLLALLAWRHRAILLAVALLFSAAGDALLAIDGEKLFVPALASFLTTHILYAVIFIRLDRDAVAEIVLWRKAVPIVTILSAAVYATLLWPNLGALTIPVLFYLCAIVGMTVLSFRARATIVPIGALLFMLSDSLISYEKFLHQTPWIGAVWVTYALAQQLMTHGLIGDKTAIASS